MPVSRAYLKPRSVDQPPQGDFEYLPIIKGFEDSTLAGLNAQLDAEKQVQAQSVDYFYVVEEIEYQVVVTKLGPNPDMLYSAMVFGWEIRKV